MKNKSIILLSGGLDSVVALSHCIKTHGIELALTFDYGQKSLKQELVASKKIADYYKLQHKIIKLDWLKDITTTALVSEEIIPTSNLGTQNSAELVWVPNRNSLFLNIAACFADSYKYNYIIYGANKDEGSNFPDNTEDFRGQISKLFENSTMAKPKVIAPLINYTKDDIVKLALEENVPLEFVRSCYNSGERHCGRCESCTHLKNALIANSCTEILERLFD